MTRLLRQKKIKDTVFAHCSYRCGHRIGVDRLFNTSQVYMARQFAAHVRVCSVQCAVCSCRLDNEVMKPVSPKSEVHSFAGVDGDSRIERPKRLRQDTFTLQQIRLCAPFASRLPCSPISCPSSRCSFSALPRGPRPHRRCA